MVNWNWGMRLHFDLRIGVVSVGYCRTITGREWTPNAEVSVTTTAMKEERLGLQSTGFVHLAALKGVLNLPI